ncbi:unnamed protein product [Spirodela intermedia]|uniref:Uncharacterized protein n=1 Tax=Spirodela intermedia TaxID=51605 RepID=A0ABN7EBF5_SPIIN|nr:unnamed protein product [Spirodela intermedia]
MAPPSSTSPTEAVLRKPKKGPPFRFLVPLIYAPILQKFRISLRRNPVLRDRLFYGVLAGAFAHGTISEIWMFIFQKHSRLYDSCYFYGTAS